LASLVCTDQTKEVVSEISEPRVPGEGHERGPCPKVGGCGVTFLHNEQETNIVNVHDLKGSAGARSEILGDVYKVRRSRP